MLDMIWLALPGGSVFMYVQGIWQPWLKAVMLQPYCQDPAAAFLPSFHSSIWRQNKFWVCGFLGCSCALHCHLSLLWQNHAGGCLTKCQRFWHLLLGALLFGASCLPLLCLLYFLLFCGIQADTAWCVFQVGFTKPLVAC